MSTDPKPLRYANLLTGDPVPWFSQKTELSPRFSFDSMAGRYILLCFFGSAANPRAQAALQVISQHRAMFNDDHISFFGITTDPSDVEKKRIRNQSYGIRFFHDLDETVSRLYGALPRESDAGQGQQNFWLLIDPMLRVIKKILFKPDLSDHDELTNSLENLPPVHLNAGFETPAPIIVIPRVFEPELCQRLIGLYEKHGGGKSGVMRQIDGKTVGVYDDSFKSRSDYIIHEKDMIKETMHMVKRRIVPEILKVHQYKVTRMERYIVACYAAEDGGHFQAHRDNTSKGTAHRRFAVSINLNSEFEGAEICFPEYSQRSFKPPVGGAVVFSCSILHRVSKITSGKRYAFLPFLYDDAAAQLREENRQFLGGEIRPDDALSKIP